MLRSILATAVLAAIPVAAARAQAPSWEWGLQGGGTASDEGTRVAANAAGDLYIAANFQDSASFSAARSWRAAKGFGRTDACILKLSRNGVWVWAYPVGGSGADTVRDVKVDPAGNVYLLATVQGDSVRIGSAGGTIVRPLGAGEKEKVLLAKYDPDGHLLWSRIAGGEKSTTAGGLAIEKDGGACVIGTFTGTISAPPGAVASRGGSDLFLARFSPAGDLRLLMRAGGSGDDTGEDVGVDGYGSMVIVGEFAGVADISGRTVSGLGERNLLLARLASNGLLLWAQAEGGRSFQGSGPSILVSPDGDFHLTGTFYKQAQIGTVDLTSQGESDIYLIRFASDGVAQWGSQFGGERSQQVADIAAGRDGAVVISGASQDLAAGSIFIAAYGANGELRWHQEDGGGNGPRTARPGGLALDSAGNIYLTGGFGGGITFGPSTLASIGSAPDSIAGTDLLLAKLGAPAAAGDAEDRNVPSLRVGMISPAEIRVMMALRRSGPARLALYDARGALIRTLADEPRPAGEYELSLNVSDLPAGAYFLVLRGRAGAAAGSFCISR